MESLGLYGAVISLTDGGKFFLAQENIYPWNENQTYLVVDDNLRGLVTISVGNREFCLSPKMYTIVQHIPS